MINIVKKYGVSKIDILKNFPVFCNSWEISRILRQYEYYRETIEMPGDIVVIGKNIAIPLINFANLTEVQTVGDRTRLVLAFDEYVESERYSSYEYYSELRDKSLCFYDIDRFVGWKKRVKLYEGNIVDIVRNFVNENHGLKSPLVYCSGLSDAEYLEIENILSGKHIVRGGKIVRDHGE